MNRRIPPLHFHWPPAGLWLVGYALIAALLCAAIDSYHLPPLLVLLLVGPAAAASLNYQPLTHLGMALIISLAATWAAWMGGGETPEALGTGLITLLVMLGSLAFLRRQSLNQTAVLRQAVAKIGRDRQETSDRFNNIIHQSTEGVCLMDLQGRVIEWNRTYEELTGILRAEALGRPLWEIMGELAPPDTNLAESLPRAKATLLEFLATGKAIPQHEMRVHSRTGEVRYLLITDFIIPTRQGSLGCSTARDATHYRLAEQALLKREAEFRKNEAILRESERVRQEADVSFRMLFENSPDGIILTDIETRRIVDCNQNAARMNGYERAELINRSIDDLHIHGYSDNVMPEEKARTLEILKKDVWRTEVIHKRKDGSLFTIETSMSLIVKDGRPMVMGIDRDISERKQMEAALRASESLFRGLFTQSPIGLAIYDAAGRLQELNPACLEIFGVTDGDSVMGFSLFDDPNFPTEHKDSLRQGKRVRCELNFDFELVKEHDLYATSKSGKRWLDVAASPLMNDDTINGFMVQMMDISERKRSQQSEHETRLLAEALVDGASALNSTLLLDEVLDHILTSIAQILPHDALLVMLIEDGMCNIVSQHDLSKPRANRPVQQRAFPLDAAPVLEKVVQSRHWLISSDAPLIHSWLGRQPDFHWVRSVMIVPLISRNEVIGMLAVFNAQPSFFSELHAQRLQAFAGQAASAIANARLYNEVHDLATHDELTGLLNRRAVISQGRREIERTRRFKRPLTALFIDIDSFKQFNDRYSYEVGDQVLCFIARQLRSSVREVDLIARYGGEEFVALLTECGMPEAIDVAERLRHKIETSKAFTEMGELGVTVSIGLAQIRLSPGLTGQLTGSDQKTLEELFQRAGQALHKAKQNGRNRIEVAPELPNLRM